MNLFLAGEGPTKPGKSLRPLARMIDQVAADVMLVQEVGSTASLQLLNQRLAKPYEYCAAVVGNSNRRITSYNVCYTKLLRYVTTRILGCD